MTDSPFLVVNADDLGLSEGVNRGIEHCFHQGLLRSASLMPNGPAFAQAVEVAARNPGLGVGVHLSLVDEQAVAPRDRLGRLVDAQGRLPGSYREFVAGWLGRRFGPREVGAEIAAQLDRVREAGMQPTHLDSHQHLHLLPGVLTLVLAAAREAGIGVVRVPHDQGAPSGVTGGGRRVQMSVLGSLAWWGGRRVRRAGLLHADWFWGLGQSGALDEPGLLAILDRLCPGVNELMCHPGFADPALTARYQWGYHWDQEAGALCAERVLRAVEEKGLPLVNFAQVLANSGHERPLHVLH